AYRNVDELMELLALIKSLGDQVSTVAMMEPPHVQLQDLLREPFRNRRNTKASEHANEHRSLAYWQIRALDVPACVSKRRWNGPAVRFNLSLNDPLYELLEGEPWRGVGGDYVVQVGESSEAVLDQESGLPTLRAGVGAFTRMLFGIVSASKLAVTDELAGPETLLAELDAAFVLPTARTTWDF
ncbi:MAG: sterol carrier protein domain-containing protein, partial [Gammaproteobacteria bacterium]|nr:sterol carrier protein domain-containing protein [Gammaproteobacteria bacterium]